MTGPNGIRDERRRLTQLTAPWRPRTVPRPRRKVGPGLYDAARWLGFRYSRPRDALVLRGIGRRWGPVLQLRREPREPTPIALVGSRRRNGQHASGRRASGRRGKAERESAQRTRAQRDRALRDRAQRRARAQRGRAQQARSQRDRSQRERTAERASNWHARARGARRQRTRAK